MRFPAMPVRLILQGSWLSCSPKKASNSRRRRRTRPLAVDYGRSSWMLAKTFPSEKTSVRFRSSESAMRPIAWPGLHAIFFAQVRKHFHRDFAEAFVGVGLRIIRDGVGVAQIFANGLEGLYLFLPGLGEIGFSAGTGGNALEHIRRDRVLGNLVGGDDVNRDSLVFRN